MNNSIVDAIEQTLTADYLNKLSIFTDESHGVLRESLKQLLPVLFNNIKHYLAQSASPNLLLELIHSLPDLNLKSIPFETLLQHSGEGNPLHDIVQLIAPDNHQSGINQLLAGAGAKLESTPLLLNLGAMLLLKPMQHYLRTKSQQMLSLKSWLQEQPCTVSGLQFLTPGGGKIRAIGEKKCGVPKWLWLLLLALLLALLFGIVRGCKNDSEGVADTTTTMWKNLGNFFKVELPDGRTLNIPELGLENKLLAFIKSERPLSDTLWFSFDRLLFETNSATLKPESQEQLNNIAEILKAYPAVNLLLAGYTDDTGTDDVNMRLSQTRAESVMQALVNQGIEASRLSAKGFGSANPVVPNDSDENRARNRRIDIQVTNK